MKLLSSHKGKIYFIAIAALFGLWFMLWLRTNQWAAWGSWGGLLLAPSLPVLWWMRWRGTKLPAFTSRLLYQFGTLGYFAFWGFSANGISGWYVDMLASAGWLALAGVLAGLYGFLVAVTLGTDNGLNGFTVFGGDAVTDCVADNHRDDREALVGVDCADSDQHGHAHERNEGDHRLGRVRDRHGQFLYP